MRLEAQSAAIRELFPADYADLALAVTELGGSTGAMIVLALLFWLSSRHRRNTALIVSYAFAGLALLVALKSLIGLPRPPDAVLLPGAAGEADGYGFPSGHAFAAVVVYGGLLSAFDRRRDPRAVLAVGAVVVAVSLSRVVLGVHYLGDVIAGAAIGLAFLPAMNRLTRGDPTRGFAIAVVLSLSALAVAGATEDALLGFGGSVGGVLATLGIDDYGVPALRSRLEAATLVGLGAGGTVGVRALEAAVAVAPLLAGLYAVLVAWILLAPSAVARCSTAVFDSLAQRRGAS
ncbi:phosphatase PAP2 family protein [Halopiger aswanensis]|uniref:PAP2 superfamily protein n=1 Tax=Halopiger aswanensis TaxID=148449 RepID=A0A419WR79_9EURY|nr:phosphatase PAP2 family protein [Halopiger aswanensis]RKD97952.1 PAP2 superfamily protein [Halopiger aswanensis]